MRKNYFAKLLKYVKSVYNIEKGLKELSYGRKNPTYKTYKVIVPLLFGFILRTRSFNELSHMIKDKEFKNVLGNVVNYPA